MLGRHCLFVWGVYSVQQNPIDAIPDLSENQVIVFTEWMGRSPQVMEDQVTYPLVSNLQGIPKVKNIRGASMFGMSFVYIIFEDYVLFYNQAKSKVDEDDYLVTIPFDAKKGFSREFLAYFAETLNDVATKGLDDLMDFLADENATDFALEWDTESFENGT